MKHEPQLLHTALPMGGYQGISR